MTELTAQRNEAAGTITVDFRGQQFTVDLDCRKDIDVVDEIEQGHVVAATKLVLGPEQWQSFRSSKPKPSIDTITELFDVLGKAVAGATAGE